MRVAETSAGDDLGATRRARRGLFIPTFRSIVNSAALSAGLALALPAAALYTTLTADTNGEAAASTSVPSSACGWILQVIDTATCAPSNIAAIP